MTRVKKRDENKENEGFAIVIPNIDVIKTVKLTKRTKILTLDCPSGKEQVVYDLRDIKETYPNVTTLKIKKGIINIHILNRTFPNIRTVKSESDWFANNEKILIRIDFSCIKKGGEKKGCLLNTFCLEPGEILDLKKVCSIYNMAFDGCETSSINNADYIEDIYAGAFTGSYFNSPEMHAGDGPIMLGNCLIGFKDKTESFELTQFVKTVALAENFGKNMIQKLIVSDYHLLEVLWTVGDDNKICDTLVINDRSDFSDSISGKFCMNANHVEVTSKNKYLKSENDMIYGIEDHKLYTSAWFLSGDVVIPKEVTSFGDDAFPSENITSIEIHPDVCECSSKAFVNPGALALIKCHDNKLPAGLIYSLTYTKQHYYKDRNAVIEVVSDDAHFFIPRHITNITKFAELCSTDMSQIKENYMYAGSAEAKQDIMVKTYAFSQDDKLIEDTLKREGKVIALRYIKENHEDDAILLVNSKLLDKNALTAIKKDALKSGMEKLVSAINSL